MYVFMYVCMYGKTGSIIIYNICMYVCISMYVQICVYEYFYSCLDIYVFILCTCMPTRPKSMYVCMYVCMCMVNWKYYYFL